MKNNQFKIPENAQVHENFRTWKSGKQWLYASSILALVVSGGAIASSSHGVFADQVLSTSTGKTTGAENTATGGLGSNATAGADNASVANSANTVAKSSANPSSYTDAQVNSSSAVLKQDNNSGNPIGAPETSNSQNTNGTGGATTIGINSSSTASSGGTINTTSSTNLNSNGAVTAGSGAASQTTVDIKATQSISNSGSTLSDGSYSWTVSPSTDQTQAGYSVAAVTITTPGTDSGQSSAGGATAQLAGGTYTKLTSGQPSSGSFTATSTANTITASSVAANNSMIDALRKSNASIESAYYSETAVLISDGATTVLSSLASNVSSAFALVSAVATSDNLLTYSSAYSLLSATLTSIQASYTASSLLALQNMSSAGSYAIAASNATTTISSASSVVSSATSTASVASSNAISNSSEMNKQSAFSVAAIVSATEKQTLDVSKRFNPQSKLFTIPVGVVPNEVFSEKRIDMKERRVHSVLVTARVAPEKRIDHIIRAIGIARQTVPDITLDFYGYVDHRDDDSAQKAINAAIKEYHMEEAVHQFEYANNVGELQKDFQVYALASIMEGFNLSLMEAISHGMVGVTYDVNYGPNELIVDGENGFVVPYEGIQEMADRLVELFTQEDKLQKMSTQSYELARRYSEENVWKAWQALIDDANKKNIDYRSPITEGIGDQRIYSAKKSK